MSDEAGAATGESARLATSDDLVAIEAIAEAQRSAIVGQRGAAIFAVREASAGRSPAELQDLLSAADTIVIVGCYDAVVFGYGIVVLERLTDGATLARLTDFVVDSEIRGSGIGEAMMNLVVAQAEAAGCVGIDSVALPGDRETKNFFESFGLKARLLTVHRALGADEES